MAACATPHPEAIKIYLIGDGSLTCKRGRDPNSKGVAPSQKASSLTVSSATSHSEPIAKTLAMNFWSSPRRFTCTCTEQRVGTHAQFSSTCASSYKNVWPIFCTEFRSPPQLAHRVLLVKPQTMLKKCAQLCDTQSLTL